MNMKQLRITFACGAALLAAVPAFALKNDEVISQYIKEADGTTGQNTNAGAGVKTGHIQNGAVTAAKLGIVCPDGQYLKFTVPDGWVCSVGTPGPAGPQGLVGPQGPEGPQGPAGSMPAYANVVVVAKSGGDFDNPIAAISACAQTASVDSPCVVKIMPGTYDVGAGGLSIPSYVEVEGSGESNTLINGDASTLPNYSSYPVVVGSLHSAVHKLTLRRHTQGGSGIPIGISTTQDMLVSDVTIDVSSPSAQATRGVFVYNGGKITLERVTVYAKGPNVAGIGGEYSGHLSIRSSKVEIDQTGVVGSDVYTSGIILQHSSADIHDVDVKCWGGNRGSGIGFGTSNEGYSTLSDSSISFSAASEAVAVYTGLDVVDIRNSTMIALPSPYSFGFQGGSNARIDSSVIKGNDALGYISGSPRISNSRLEGTVPTGLKCSNVIDANFDPILCN